MAIEKPEPRLLVNPTLGSEELLEELAGRLQQLYGSLDALAVRCEAEGLELIYDALWALLEDTYQVQALRDALKNASRLPARRCTPVTAATCGTDRAPFRISARAFSSVG